MLDARNRNLLEASERVEVKSHVGFARPAEQHQFLALIPRSLHLGNFLLDGDFVAVSGNSGSGGDPQHVKNQSKFPVAQDGRAGIGANALEVFAQRL